MREPTLGEVQRNPVSKSMLHEEITKDIIGAAMAVLNELKPGLDEKLYERALIIELRARGHIVEQQREYPVYYRGELIGTLRPDLIVDGKVIAIRKWSLLFQRHAHRPDARLPEHHRFGGCFAP